MLIQVGELAKRAGLTVRTLHHYEQTGLLTPSARSEAGYRLYNLSAVQRLHMIKALAQAGLTLATIKDYLDRQTLSLPELLTQQIDMLNAQLRDVGRLRDRLLVLRETLASGNEPDLE
ncbi:TPA: MerR family transcriptional regulator, partial [Klebsiella pneumoniae]|nr:MerR family transcriptional regulator [Klebsiella pneumoniae]